MKTKTDDNTEVLVWTSDSRTEVYSWIIVPNFKSPYLIPFSSTSKGASRKLLHHWNSSIYMDIKKGGYKQFCIKKLVDFMVDLI